MTKQAWLQKWFCYALWLLPVWWLDAFVLSRWPVFGATPALLPIAVTAVAVLEGASGGAGFGFATGLLWATAYPGGHGSRVFLLTLIGLFTGALAQYALSQSLFGCLLCSAVALAVVELVHIAEDLFFLRALPGPALLAALPQLLWTLCWVPVVYGIFSRAFDRVGGDRLS